MEIPHHIITQAVAASRTSPVNKGLQETLSKIEGFSALDFIGKSRPEQIERAGQAVHGYASVGIFTNGRSDADCVAALAPVIATIYPYLTRGIEEAKLQPLLIFLMVNALLRIPLRDLLTSEEMADPKMTALSAAITGVYGNGIGDFTPAASGPRQTANLVQTYLEGVAEANVAKAYRLVDQYQQTNKPPLNYLISNLLAFLYQLDPTQALQLLQAKPQPMAYATYFFFFSEHVLRTMATDYSITENWLLFEVIRQLIFPKNRQEENADIPLFTSALRQIAQRDFAFFKQAARYFRRDNAVCAGVGAYLPETTDAEVSQVLTECYPVAPQNDDHLARNALAKGFAEKASESQLKHLFTVIFQMWWAFMNEAAESGKTHSQGIILTDYADLVPCYYIRVAPGSDLEDIMFQTIRRVQWIDTQWSRSQFEQLATYRALQSILFLLSFAYKAKGMHIAFLEAEYMALLRHPIQLSRYATNELKTQFPKAIENMQ